MNFLHRSIVTSAIIAAATAALLVPRAAGAQVRSPSASVGVSATVMPACRLDHDAEAVVSRLDDSSTQVVARLKVASNARYRIVVRAIRWERGGGVGDERAGRQLRVRDSSGDLVVLSHDATVPVVTLQDPGIRVHEIMYRLVGGAMTKRDVLVGPRVGVSCVVDQPGVATGVVVEL